MEESKKIYLVIHESGECFDDNKVNVIPCASAEIAKRVMKERFAKAEGEYNVDEFFVKRSGDTYAHLEDTIEGQHDRLYIEWEYLIEK